MSLPQHAFGQVIERVFRKDGDEEKLSIAEIREHIAAVKDEGSSDSLVKLILAYAPLLRHGVGRNKKLSVEEARDAVIDALIEVIYTFDFDTEDHLGKRLPSVISTKLGIAEEDHRMIRVPHWTERRYYRIWNLAGQDVNVALALAPSEGMERETFLAVYAVKTFAPELPDDARQRSLYVDLGSEHTSSDLDYYVDHSMAIATPDEWTVLRFAYGFVTGDAMSDGEVSQAWSEQELGPVRVASGEYIASRAKVQRLRTGAITKIRKSLGIEE